MNYGFAMDEPTLALTSVRLELPLLPGDTLAAKKGVISAPDVVTANDTIVLDVSKAFCTLGPGGTDRLLGTCRYIVAGVDGLEPIAKAEAAASARTPAVGFDGCIPMFSL